MAAESGPGEPPPATHTVALGVEYDGSAFSGFQRQRHAPSVQSALECATAKVANEPVAIAAAGRTDAGVHATQQVVSFATNAERPLHAWQRGITSLTPAAIGIVWAKVLPAPFHARFSALWRRYVYVFSDAPTRPVLHRQLVAWCRQPLDTARMNRAAQCLVGEHDFSAFRAAACQSSTPMRCVHNVRVQRRSSYVVLEITANAFLLHMVRNLAGALQAVGTGALAVADVRRLLASRDRGQAPPTAPAQGLYLVAVGYPNWPLPVRPPPVLAAA